MCRSLLVLQKETPEKEKEPVRKHLLFLRFRVRLAFRLPERKVTETRK